VSDARRSQIASVLGFVVVAFAVPAVAHEPTRFADLPWGTDRVAFEERCPTGRDRNETERVRDIRDC
jgi:hypothetical protein